MTALELSESMHRIADAIADLPNGNLAKFPPAMLSGDAAVGAAGMLCYLRDLFTVAGKDQFTREEILVLLEIASRDDEIFPCATGALIWDME